MNIDKKLLNKLYEEAKRVSKQAYAPYSRFRVGAAILGQDGKIFSGTNVENASYGLAICAERNAIFSGITQGNKTIYALVIYTPTKTPTTPCGACRQVIREFSENATIISICDTEERLEMSIDAMLPRAFASDNLAKKGGEKYGKRPAID